MSFRCFKCKHFIFPARTGVFALRNLSRLETHWKMLAVWRGFLIFSALWGICCSRQCVRSTFEHGTSAFLPADQVRKSQTRHRHVIQHCDTTVLWDSEPFVARMHLLGDYLVDRPQLLPFGIGMTRHIVQRWLKASDWNMPPWWEKKCQNEDHVMARR